MNKSIYLVLFLISSFLFGKEEKENSIEGGGVSKISYGQYLKELFNELPTTPVEDSENEAVAKGEILSEEARLITDLSGDNRITYGKDEHEKTLSSRLQYITLAEFANKNKSPEAFLKSLLPYKDRLPPTRADLIIYRACWVNFNEISMNSHGASIEFWQQFANAKNPIYRMLSVKGSVSSIPEEYKGFHTKNGPADPRLRYWLANDRIAFLKQFVNEEEPLILRNLYSAFYQTVHPEILEILNNQLTREIVLNNKELLAHLNWVRGVIKKEVNLPYYTKVMQSNPISESNLLEDIGESVGVVEAIEEEQKPVLVKKEEPKPIEKVEEPVMEQEEEKFPIILYIIGILAIVGIYLVTRNKNRDR